MRCIRRFAIVGALLVPFLIVNRSSSVPTPTEDKGVNWPMFGGSPARNMANLNERGIVSEWSAADGERKNVRWVADLGSSSYSSPVIAEGRVFIGTNNEKPRNPRDRKFVKDNNAFEPLDKGILMCFDAKTGEFLWQAVHDKRPSGQVNDWPRLGLTSTPSIENGRVYYVNNYCELICADINGFHDGKNDGVQDEKYQDKTDADIIWRYDMMTELKVFPHNASHCSPLIVGERIFVNTGNGVDEGHINLPSPDAPSFVCFDKKTGKPLWQSSLPGKNILHGQWSSPAYAVIKNVPQVIFAAGDGWLYALKPESGELIWKFDANPKDAKYALGGTGTRGDFLAMPVVYRDRIYIGTGQDPEHMDGVGHFWCIDPAGKSGDISPDLVTDAKVDPPKTKPNPNSGAVWHYGGNDARPLARREHFFGRTMSTACIVDDIIYLAETTGYFHCLNARSGEVYWVLDTQAAIWGSAMHADGKIFLANEDGDVYVIKHDPKPETLNSFEEAAKQKDAKTASIVHKAIQKLLRNKIVTAKVEMDAPIRGTPAAAGGMLFIGTEKKLYAIGVKK
jgi:outer membrane protein assembly factor BamB